MADDAWTGEIGTRPRAVPLSRASSEQLRLILADVEGRLSDPVRAPLATRSAASLARALEALATRLSAQEDQSLERQRTLAAAVGDLARRLDAHALTQARVVAQVADSEARLSARIDVLLDELADLRAGQLVHAERPLLPRLLLSTAGLAAGLSVLAAGAIVLSRPEILPAGVAKSLDRMGLRSFLAAEPRTSPKALAGAGKSAPPAAASGAGPSRDGDSFEAAAGALEAGDAKALARITGLAKTGDTRAQLQLASLYEAGSGGLPKDLLAARRWTRAAAEAGDRIAMHNLALYLAAGQGGPLDEAASAQWFRRAADRGVVDSQYNLGLLYEAGRGVGRNLREAYKWFSVAANAGDVAAREKQIDLERRLKVSERAAVDGDVAAFKADGATSGREIVIAPASSVAESQALLARKGYYVGPADGAGSDAYRAAANAYLRDHPDSRLQ